MPNRTDSTNRIDAILARSGGAANLSALADATSHAFVEAEVRRGLLVRVFPQAYVRPWCAGDAACREAAAIASVGRERRPAAISHTSALRRWGLHEADETVHVLTQEQASRRCRPGLVIHSTRLPGRVVRHDGVPTLTVDWALATGWSILPPAPRRRTVIGAVRQRLTTTHQLREVARLACRLPGRSELIELVGLLERGCESELEIWGLLKVFDAPGLRHAVRQREVRVNGRQYRLDLAYETERVAVELDGYRHHSSRQQRERDMRRDMDLASIGWITLRVSYRRITTDPAGVRADVLAVLASRR